MIKLIAEKVYHNSSIVHCCKKYVSYHTCTMHYSYIIVHSSLEVRQHIDKNADTLAWRWKTQEKTSCHSGDKSFQIMSLFRCKSRRCCSEHVIPCISITHSTLLSRATGSFYTGTTICVVMSTSVLFRLFSNANRTQEFGATNRFSMCVVWASLGITSTTCPIAKVT